MSSDATSDSSSSNLVEDIAKGAAKGVLEWSSEKVASFVKKLKDRKLAFIQEPKTIDVVKEQYRSGEAKFYEVYIRDKELLFIVRLGLTLRKLEEDKERLRNLRNKVFKKYGVEGLHIAEFVQNGVLNRYIGVLLQDLTSIEKLEKDICEILKNIEKHTVFVQGTSNKPEIIKSVDIKVHANSPNIFIISGFKSAAKMISESIDSLRVVLKNYEFERWSSGEKEILFLKRRAQADGIYTTGHTNAARG